MLKNHLNADTLEKLRRVFAEARWFTNNAEGIFDASYKVKKVQVKDSFETRDIKVLSSQMRQSIIETCSVQPEQGKGWQNKVHKTRKFNTSTA